MGHNSRARANFTDLTPVTAAELNKMDLGQAQSINGDLGGVWDPTGQIIVGGDGMWVVGPFRADSATLNTPILNTPEVSAPPTYVTPKIKKIAVPCRTATPYTGPVTPGAGGVATYISNPDTTEAHAPIQGFPGFRTTYINTGAGSVFSAAYPVDLDAFLKDGATLVSALLTATILPTRGTVPAVKPAFGIFRFPVDVSAADDEEFVFDSAGALPSTCRLLSTFSQPDLISSPTLAQYVAHYEIANFVPDQNAVIDLSNWTYRAVIWDEGGTGAVIGNAYNHIVLTLSVPHMQL